jgi:protein phosphatase
MFGLTAFAGSEKGDVRPVNQDRVYMNITQTEAGDRGVFCVADGMGGLADGHYAASVAVETVRQWEQNQFALIEDANSVLPKELNALFSSINQTIINNGNEKSSQLGTTCSLLLITGGQYYIAHAGDSRVYLNPGGLFTKRALRQLTQDHANGNKLTSCLGIMAFPRIDIFCGDIKRGNIFLLCSDGLYRVASAAEMGKLISKHKNPETIGNELLAMGLHRNTTDNASVIVVRCAD